jgi:flagellar motor component MotA
LLHVDIRETNINSVPNFISSIKTLKQSIRIIPKDNYITYRCFCNCYYKLFEIIIRLNKKARREGLLALEDDLEYFSDDFFRQGMRLVVDGTDSKVIKHLMTLEIERDHDYYKKKLMEIAMEGILSICDGDSTHIITLKLASMVDLKNNLLDAACTKYLAGESEPFDNINLKAAVQPEEECEERRFLRRVYFLREITRKE